MSLSEARSENGDWMSTRDGKAASKISQARLTIEPRIGNLGVLGPSSGAASWYWSAQNIVTYALLLPAAVVLVLCFFLPLLLLLAISFSGDGGTFSAYTTILFGSVVRAVFLTSLQIVFVVTLITILLGYPAVYLLTNVRGTWLLTCSPRPPAP